jgi:DNA-binding beta-propeller fold protein YncE
MRLGTAGVAGGGADHFNLPSAVVRSANGDIFVADGHGGMAKNTPADYVTRIVKFSKAGHFITQWGKLGSGPGEFRNPHALAIDSRGRLFVADRGNLRIQIFDSNGKFLAQWKQFGAPCGLYIDKSDTLYAVDCDSHPGLPKGIWMGSAKTGTVTSFVPDDHAGEGIVAGLNGNLYAAVNAVPHGITEYPKH